jgi:hypothetical protein
LALLAIVALVANSFGQGRKSVAWKNPGDQIAPNAASSSSMGHELATNATMYGAPSSAAGSVSVMRHSTLREDAVTTLLLERIRHPAAASVRDKMAIPHEAGNNCQRTRFCIVNQSTRSSVLHHR